MTVDHVTLSESKKRIAAIYNLAADGYDKPAPRFFRLIVRQLVEMARLKEGATVLDAATGTEIGHCSRSSSRAPTDA